jgi:Uma2 family endonuclease
MSAASTLDPPSTFAHGDVLQGRYTVEQFLAWMRIRPERFELHGDRIVCMSGTKKEHREAVDLLDEAIRKSGGRCRIDIAEAVKATAGSSPYYFPDLAVVCSQREYENIDGYDVVKNPCAIVEVLSSSTRKADETFKLQSYLGLESVELVALVDTEERRVVLHTRGGSPRAESRATMRELAEHVAGAIASLACARSP